jgi:hypothetical protein
VRYVGRLEQLSVEGGVWLLVTDEGRRFQLTPPPSNAVSGVRAEIEGDEQPQGVSFQMTAPILRVHSWRRIDGR